MNMIIWYFAIGAIVVTIDLLIEKLRNSNAYKELIEDINEQGDLRGFYILGFLTGLIMFWPIELVVMLYDYIMTIMRRL